MTALERQHPPMGSAGVSSNPLGGGIESDSTADTTTATRYSRPSRATIWAVRRWRPGWKGGRDARIVRFFARRMDAERYMDFLDTVEENDCGPLYFELSFAPRGKWEVVDR